MDDEEFSKMFYKKLKDQALLLAEEKYFISSNFDIERTYAFIGQYAGQCVQETIASGGVASAGQSFPIRSPFTMKVYNYRGEGHKVVEGNINTTKSMVLTGNMLGSITYKVVKG